MDDFRWRGVSLFPFRSSRLKLSPNLLRSSLCTTKASSGDVFFKWSPLPTLSLPLSLVRTGLTGFIKEEECSSCLASFYLISLFFPPLANQPESKVCVHGYLFPLPVALGAVPHPIYDATAGTEPVT